MNIALGIIGGSLVGIAVAWIDDKHRGLRSVIGISGLAIAVIAVYGASS